MRRLLSVCVCVLVGCGGDSSDPPPTPDAPVAAICNDDDPTAFARTLPNVTQATSAQCGPEVAGAVRCYKVSFTQPVNQKQPSATFTQILWVMHRGCDRPTVIADWGYSNDRFYDDELPLLFDANAIWVEHRFQGASAPTGTNWDWRQLTIENAANDLHRIIETFKPMYPARWISTGGSKGGITATYHRYFFPDDVDGTVAYVAPASEARVDLRYRAWMDGELTSACAQAVRDAQVAAQTTRRDMMLARLAAIGASPDLLDYMTRNFDWRFWQRYGDPACSSVPDAATTDEDFWTFFHDRSGFFDPQPPLSQLTIGARYYEWLTEHGFPLQVGAHVRDLIQSARGKRTMEDDFVALFPQVPLPAFDGSVTAATRQWAEQSAENLLLVYGQYDPWSGGALAAPARPTSARFIAPNETHSGAAIATLAPPDRSQALALAEAWFGVPAHIAAMQRAAEATARRAELLSRHEQQLLVPLR